jgi:hypothetical protein
MQQQQFAPQPVPAPVVPVHSVVVGMPENPSSSSSSLVIPLVDKPQPPVKVKKS